MFEEIPTLLSKVTVLFYIPIVICEFSNFFTTLSILVICLFSYSHPNGYEIVCHWGFDLHFPDGSWYSLFFMCLLTVSLLWRNVCSVLLLISSLITIRVFMYSGYRSLIRHTYFFPFCGLSFYLMVTFEGPSSQSYGFSSGHGWMWELDHKKAECWRIDAFKLCCWRTLLRFPCTARRSNWSILKDINPEFSLDGLMMKLKLQYFVYLMRRVDSLEKILMVQRLKAKGE